MSFHDGWNGHLQNKICFIHKAYEVSCFMLGQSPPEMQSPKPAARCHHRAVCLLISRLAKPSPFRGASGYRGHHIVITHQISPYILFPRSTRAGVIRLTTCSKENNRQESLDLELLQPGINSVITIARKRLYSAHMRSSSHRPLGSNEYGCRSRRATGLCRRG